MSKRSAPEPDLPSQGDPDRKRVLNILAQRRYRQKKKEKLAALEAQAKAAALTEKEPIARLSDDQEASGTSAPNQAHNTWPTPPSDGEAESSPPLESYADRCEAHRQAIFTESPAHQQSVPTAPLHFTSLAASWTAASQLPELDFPTVSAEETTPPITDPYHEEDTTDNFPSSALTFLPDSVIKPDTYRERRGKRKAARLLTQPVVAQRSQDIIRQHVAKQPASSPSFYFPISPDINLEIPCMKLLNIGVNLASIMGSTELFWDPTSQWTLPAYLSQPIHRPNVCGGETQEVLPPTFLPTPAQLAIPHHPLLDILPWPSVRTKLICVFHLPKHLRPPSARSMLGVMQLGHDMDDLTEGLRVWGGDGSKAEDWEVGEAFFRNWWWALDGDILKRTNELRRRRGASRLRIEDVTNKPDEMEQLQDSEPGKEQEQEQVENPFRKPNQWIAGPEDERWKYDEWAEGLRGSDLGSL